MIRGGFHETVVGSPPEGWQIGHVTMQLLFPSELVQIEAWRRGAFAVHELTYGARLTHAPTGLRIWNTCSMDQAAELAERLEGLADWDAITATMPIGSDLYPKVKEIIDGTARTRRCEQK
jgi:hypothetical protein